MTSWGGLTMDNATVNDAMAAEFEQELLKVLPELEWEADDERLRYCRYRF